MQFEISSSALLAALRRANSVITPNPNLPILETVYIALLDNSIRLLSSGVHASLELCIPFLSGQDGEVCVDIKSLISYLSLLPEKQIMCYTQDRSFVVFHGSGQMSFPAEDTKDYPPFGNVKESLLRAYDKRYIMPMLRHLLETAKTDDGFTVFSNVLFDGTDAVSMDDKTFQRYTLNAPVNERFLVSKKAIQQVIQAFGDFECDSISMGCSGNYSVYSAPGLTVKCISGVDAYPDYTKIIPAQNKDTVLVNRTEFISSLKRITLSAGGNDKIIKLSIEDQEIKLEASNPAFDFKAKESCKCDTSLEDGYSIGLPIEHLLKQVSFCKDEDLTLSLGASNSPLMIIKDNSLSLVASLAI